jgi:hypothetical protein
VCFCTLTANVNTFSQKGSLIHLTSHIQGIDFINFHFREIKVNFQVHISIHTQQAQACRFAFQEDLLVGTLSIAITGIILYTITLISGNQNFPSKSICGSRTIFLSTKTLSLNQEREKNQSIILAK